MIMQLYFKKYFYKKCNINLHIFKYKPTYTAIRASINATIFRNLISEYH